MATGQNKPETKRKTAEEGLSVNAVEVSVGGALFFVSAMLAITAHDGDILFQDINLLLVIVSSGAQCCCNDGLHQHCIYMTP